MAWWSRTGGLEQEPKKSVPKGIWTKCEKCAATIYDADLEQNLKVCTSCGHHFRMGTEERLRMIADEGSWAEHDRGLESTDPLGFRVDGKKYTDQLKATTKKTGPGDAYRAGTATIGGIPVELGAFVFEFMGGSMGSVVGEKITRQFERAVAHRRPAIVLCASGGARMQEGVLSLMQMAKVSAMLAQLAERRIPYIAILTNPTTGGVSASYAMLGDAIIAEPGAVIGFAGPRVIKQTLGQDLPEGFQTAEFLLDHGMLDQVVHRRDLKQTVSQLLRHMSGKPAASGWTSP
jgi:acetyl-CoA carboxylase carboxyl transferase subunit beta